MRLRMVISLITGLPLVASGCGLWDTNDFAGDALATASELVISPGGATPVASDSQTAPGAPSENLYSVSGSVRSDDFKFYLLGPSTAGDSWSIRATSGRHAAPLVAALFDENFNLLTRRYLYDGARLEHVVRDSTAALHLGVMPPAGRGAAEFNLLASRTAQRPVPPPQRQVVWLNFEGGAGVRIANRSGLSFPPFDAAALGASYAGQTALIRDAIVQRMREDFLAYEVDILSSAEVPPPDVPHSVIHLGGSEPGLLGLADNVDEYNSNVEQSAIVYVRNFEPYKTMRLTAEEMAVMVSNVASHELGHLLGLYHTHDPGDVMDTSGSAWDLAGVQRFTRALLDPAVFAYGYADSNRLLELAVGARPWVDKSAMKAIAADRERFKAVSRFIHDELPYTCGTCAEMDPH